GFWNITLDTVSRRAISVTQKPKMDFRIRIKRNTPYQG
ncbi:MAG TPA: DUF1883 domain-containing protein, partial [Pseudomonas sp.]|nr:DUF1883 domain-containing protein [Pseudomonas sp.]